MSVATANFAPGRSALVPGLPLYLGFAGTGVGVALPGVVLPALLSSWNFGDGQGGRLFLMAWLGSATGALVLRGSLRRVLTIGALLIAIGSTAVSLCGGHGAYALMFLYGLGLGLTMTATSLIRQRQAGANSGPELVRLNLLWAIGACLCPLLAAHSLRSNSFRAMLWSISLWFLALAVWASLQTELAFEADRITDAHPWQVFRRVPARLILMTALITGIEASAGGWLATYAKREGHQFAAIIAAPACFWVGLVCSRFFWSMRVTRIAQHAVIRGSLALMLSASAILFAYSRNGSAMLTAAFLLGFGIGPVYPLLLAWALRFHRAGAIFFLAGVGSACLPWITGIVSTQWHSLRDGFAVPLAGSAVLLVTSLTVPMRRWTN
jgi:FHS family glucose/mannose:H+ symporter-like MFS transporter